MLTWPVRFIVACLFLPFSAGFGQANPVLLLPDTVGHVVVQKPALQQLDGQEPQRLLPAIRQLPVARWNPVNSVNFGSQGSPGWATFQVQSKIEQTLWMEIDSHFIDSLQVWLIESPGTRQESTKQYQATGFRLMSSDRDAPTKHHYFVKPLHFRPGVRYAVYLRGWVPPGDVLKFGVHLWNPIQFWHYQQHEIAGWAVFVGLVLMSVFITLVAYAFHPQRIYLFYIAYISFMSCYALLNDGWGLFLPPSLRWLDDSSTAAHGLSLGILFMVFFSRSFLVVDYKAGRWWLRFNPLWLALLLETAIFTVHYGVHHNRHDLVQLGYQAGFGLLALYGLLWLSYIADAIQRRFRPVWFYNVSVLVWLFFYITNVFVVNTGWLTEPFPDMLVFRVALLVEVGMIFIGWMYRQRILRQSAQQLLWQQQARQQELLDMEHRRQTEELKALRLQNELQQQRERLARDLHDGIGSQLTHIAGRLDILSVRETNEQAQLQRLGQFTRETNQALRDTVWILNRSEIKLSTFAQRLHAYLLRLWEDIDMLQLHWCADELPIKTSNGDSTQSETSDTDPILSPLMVQSLFRITQEAVNNALKYANATTIGVSLTRQGNGIRLTVADNGTGFDTTRTTNSYGLTNMRKRTDEINGQWLLTSDCTGTQIHVSIDITT